MSRKNNEKITSLCGLDGRLVDRSPDVILVVQLLGVLAGQDAVAVAVLKCF